MTEEQGASWKWDPSVGEPSSAGSSVSLGSAPYKVEPSHGSLRIQHGVEPRPWAPGYLEPAPPARVLLARSPALPGPHLMEHLLLPQGHHDFTDQQKKESKQLSRDHLPTSGRTWVCPRPTLEPHSPCVGRISRTFIQERHFAQLEPLKEILIIIPFGGSEKTGVNLSLTRPECMSVKVCVRKGLSIWV